MEVTCYVGIDVAKDRLDVHIRPIARTFAVSNSASGIAELSDIIKPMSVEKITMEASGGYERLRSWRWSKPVIWCPSSTLARYATSQKAPVG